jgi:hypothetical protein
MVRVTLQLEYNWEGMEETIHWLTGVEERTEKPFGEHEVFEPLERAEMRLFESFRGKYVRTGRLMDSLTMPDATDAIRELHGESAEFDTDVWYAHLAGHRGGDYVLFIDERGAREFWDAVTRFVVEGRRP